MAAICRRLDGLPLALELAAPGLRPLSPSTLLTRLEQTGLGPGLRDLPERHRTMAAVLDWSMDLLEPEEVDLFTRLAVFSGGFSLDAVEAVTGDGPADADVLPALARSSTSHSCCGCRHPTTSPVPPPRAGAAVRDAAPPRVGARDRHGRPARRPLPRARRHPPRCSRDPSSSPPSTGWTRTTRTCAPPGCGCSSSTGSATPPSSRAASGSTSRCAAAREGLSWLERLEAGASDAARCRALTGRLGLLLLTGDVARMRQDADEAVALAGRVADPRVTCETLILAGQSAVFAGDLDDAERLLAPPSSQAQDAGRRWVAVRARIAQGQLALVAGDLATAGTVLRGAVSAARGLGNAFTLATALNVRHPHRAARRRAGDRRAPRRVGRAVARRPDELDPRLRPPALASIAQRVGDPASAAWLFGAGASISATDAVDPTFPVSRALSDRGLDATRLALGEPAFTRGVGLGRTASDDEIRSRAALVTQRARG